MFGQRYPVRRLGQQAQQPPAQDPMALNEQFYQQIKPELLEFLGQFALIHNQELVDVYPSYQAAFDGAIQKGLRAGTFLVKEIVEEEPVETI